MRCSHLTVFVVVLCAGCRDGPVGYPADFDDLISWGQEVQFQEADSALLVDPRFTADPPHGFLVADRSEAQLLQYGTTGNLRARIARRGGGPGEFRSPMIALRWADRTIIGFDRSGRFHQYDSTGATLIRSGRAPVTQIADAEVVDANHILLTGAAATSAARVHLWQPFADTLALSFFIPPFRRVGGDTRVAVRNGRVAVAFALSDTVYIYDYAGVLHERVPIGVSEFRQYRDLESLPPPPEWRGSFSTLEDVFWLQNGDLALPFADWVDNAPQWNLLVVRFESSGSTQHGYLDVPRLVTVADEPLGLYFIPRGSLLPNQLRLAKWRGR